MSTKIELMKRTYWFLKGGFLFLAIHIDNFGPLDKTQIVINTPFHLLMDL